MNCHHHQLSYLQQIGDLLKDKYKPVAARLGYISKLIQLGQQVHVKGTDAPRLTRCKACHAPINFDDIHHEKQWIRITCSLCGIQRKYGILNDQKLYRNRKRCKKVKEKIVKVEKIKDEILQTAENTAAINKTLEEKTAVNDQADSQLDDEIIEVLVKQRERQKNQQKCDKQTHELEQQQRQSKRLKPQADDDEIVVITPAPQTSPRKLRPSTKLVTKCSAQQISKSKK